MKSYSLLIPKGTTLYSFALLMIACTNGLAQWNLNSSSELYSENSGVGIGISDPTSKLEIRGTTDNTFLFIRQDKNSGGSGDLIYFRDDRGYAGNNTGTTLKIESWRGYGQQGGTLVDFTTIDNGAYKSRLFINNDNGNIGIGTNLPSSRFHISDGGFRHGSNGEINIDAPNIIGGRFKILDNGNIGIGVVAPLTKLHVANGAIMASDPNFHDINVRLDGTSIPVIRFTRYTGAPLQQHNAFVGQFYNTTLGDYSLGIGTGSSNTGDQNAALNVITIPTNGNVGIGTDNPDTKLTVKGVIHANEVRVDLNPPIAPDYVFESEYDLASLAEVEAFIKLHKHLPEIPSGKEMEENGLNLKEMNLLLLKKVEELTLYLIEQDKKIRSLEKIQK